jgi:hypothetical protein
MLNRKHAQPHYIFVQIVIYNIRENSVFYSPQHWIAGKFNVNLVLIKIARTMAAEWL